VVSSTRRPHFTPEKDPVPNLQEAGWALGPVWTGAENLVPTGIRSQAVQPLVSRYTDWVTRPTQHTHTHTHTHHTYIYIYIYKVKWSRYSPGLAQRLGRGIALLFHDRRTRRGWVVSSTRRPHFTPEKDPVPSLQEAGWALGPVWTGAENLVPTGIRSRTVQPLVSRYTDWVTRPTQHTHAHYIYTELFEMIVGVLTTRHLVLQMQPRVISFCGSRFRFMFLFFPQVSRNWRYESEPPLKPSPLTCYKQFGTNSIIVLMFVESQRVHI